MNENNATPKLQIKFETKEVTHRVLDTLKFDENISLMMYLNSIYPRHTFYAMCSPVGYDASATKTIEARSVLCEHEVDVGVTVVVGVTHNDEVGFGISFDPDADLLHNIVLPIIDEVVKSSSERDIYLHTIVAHSIVKRDNLPKLQFKVRGYF